MSAQRLLHGALPLCSEAEVLRRDLNVGGSPYDMSSAYLSLTRQRSAVMFVVVLPSAI